MSGLNPSLTIAAMLARWPETGGVLVSRRMACVGCEMNGFETIAEAAAAYGLSAAELIGDLREAVEDPGPEVNLEAADSVKGDRE